MENIGAQILAEVWAENNQNNDNHHENFEIEIDDEDDRDADGTLDGGVAYNPDDGTSPPSSKRRSTDCDIVRCIICVDSRRIST